MPEENSTSYDLDRYRSYTLAITILFLNIVVIRDIQNNKV